MRRLSLFLTGAALFAPLPLLAGNTNTSTTADALCEGAGGFLSSGTANSPKCSANTANHLTGSLGDLTNTLLFIAGAIAVIVIIIGGLRYVTSQGDSAAIKSAKDTILYAIIGLIVAILAYAIVRFVAGAI